ncbi:MAG TPA: hypothetical protein VLB68_24365, partial [Pyrinomonadaceae bacterium]|nr:hypothetical protein [Pyrinomonadaceae bacterium]
MQCSVHGKSANHRIPFIHVTAEDQLVLDHSFSNPDNRSIMQFHCNNPSWFLRPKGPFRAVLM